ncbi:ribose-phosphate pyrophosphokinase [Inhella inkyongensis]|uniref:Ribose-phosphate pyrophosphokinase n=1 Tax=Inhella inkyongensis TaxID=392593 RepID=A0A840S8D3_9BURK|nr:ribose-phosphate diphosphokinase [Inhella inkyongensis]MBB5204801.1 ribose-phosphate pyrophosphokinase [Inhella inkyongensis]
MKRPELLLAWPDEAALAQALAAALNCPLAWVDSHRFPDGESRLRLPPSLPAHTVLLRGLQRANDRLAELLLVAAGSRELGAQRLSLVSPYLGYMRQDIAFTPGEVVSQRHIGSLLGTAFDAVLTVDPHLHRIQRLDEVLRGGVSLSAAPLLGQFVATQRPGALLLAPDGEAEQWVSAAGQAADLEWAVCSKTRQGDRQVLIQLPPRSFAGRTVVLLDDVASSGGTLIEATRLLKAAGAASVDVAVTHALFAQDAEARVRAAGVGQIWSTDCIAHPSNAVSIAPLLAQGLYIQSR